MCFLYYFLQRSVRAAHGAPEVSWQVETSKEDRSLEGSSARIQKEAILNLLHGVFGLELNMRYGEKLTTQSKLFCQDIRLHMILILIAADYQQVL